MSCDGCNNNKPCKQKDCGCPVKDLYGNCVNLNLGILPCSGVNADDTLDNVILALDTFICNKFSNLSGFFRIKNVGGMSELYIGDTPTGEKKLRTLQSSDKTITITQNSEDIDFVISDTILNKLDTALQPGDNISELVNDAGYLTDYTEIDTLQTVTDRGSTTDNTITIEGGDTTNLKALIVKPVGISDHTTVDYKSFSITNPNGLFKNRVKPNGDTFDFLTPLDKSSSESSDKLKLLTANNNVNKGGTLNIRVGEFLGRVKGEDAVTNDEFTTLSQVNILIQGQVTPAIKRFIVNNKYTGSDEEGSVLRPFKTIDNALTAFLGNGTPDNPEFSGSTIVIQKGDDYIFSGNFNYRNLSVELENEAKVISTPPTGEFLVDLDVLDGNSNCKNIINLNGTSELVITEKGIRNRGTNNTTESGTKTVLVNGSGTLTGSSSIKDNPIFESNIENVQNYKNNSTYACISVKNIRIDSSQRIWNIGGNSFLNIHSCSIGHLGSGSEKVFYQVGGSIYLRNSTIYKGIDSSILESQFCIEILDTTIDKPIIAFTDNTLDGNATVNYMFNIINNSSTNSKLGIDFTVINNKSLYIIYNYIFKLTHLNPSTTIKSGITFNNNVFNNGKLDAYTGGSPDVDITSNNYNSVLNFIGRNVVNSLRTFADRADAISNPDMYSGCQFFNLATDTIDIIP